jgi:hypothetical protein
VVIFGLEGHRSDDERVGVGITIGEQAVFK